MAVPVVIKSGRKYMTLVLDSDMEFVALVQEIIAKFKANERFFGTDPIALCFEGRKLSGREKLQIMDAINEFTTAESDRLLRLPLHTNLSDEDINKVISYVKKFYEQ